MVAGQLVASHDGDHLHLLLPPLTSSALAVGEELLLCIIKQLEQ